MALELPKKVVNLNEIPLVALRHSTRNILSQRLNGTKVIPSPSNLPRDWRGVAHIARVACPNPSCCDPTTAVLSLWEKNRPSLQELLDALKEIDRWDVIDDIQQFVEKDVFEYLKSLDVKKQCHERNENQENSVLTIDVNATLKERKQLIIQSVFSESLAQNLDDNYNTTKKDKKRVLKSFVAKTRQVPWEYNSACTACAQLLLLDLESMDDIRSIESFGEPQYYDAFLLFDDSDSEFALTILNKLENEYNLKLCTKDRDLVAGSTFEHEVIMQVIRDRCRRLIVIVSPPFLESAANKFFLTFAQALGIEQRQRKIIPCVYSWFPLPLQLNYYTLLDYSRSSTFWNFWDRLNQSIRDVRPRPRALPSNESSIVTELPTESSSKNSSLAIDKWECSKKQASVTPSAPPHESSPSNASSLRPYQLDPPGTSRVSQSPNVSHVNFNSLTDDSVQSESDPIISSRMSSAASLISKVFVKKHIRPKSWFKKKKKVPVVADA